jgi:hypothetical protein
MHITKAIQPTSLGFEKAQPITITPIKSQKKTAWHQYVILSILLVLSFFGLSQRLRSSCSKTTPDVDLGRLGAVSTEISRCSRIGVDIMKMGGNAADAVSTTEYTTRLTSGVGFADSESRPLPARCVWEP